MGGIFAFEVNPGETIDPALDGSLPLLDLSLLIQGINQNAEFQADTIDPLVDTTLEDINEVDKLSFQLSTNSSPDSVAEVTNSDPDPFYF